MFASFVIIPDTSQSHDTTKNPLMTFQLCTLLNLSELVNNISSAAFTPCKNEQI